MSSTAVTRFEKAFADWLGVGHSFTFWKGRMAMYAILIGCSNYFVPIHTQPYIMEMFGTKADEFPVAEKLAARTIALPFFANLTGKQVDRVKKRLAEIVQDGGM